MTPSTQRRFVLIAVLVFGVVAGWWIFGRAAPPAGPASRPAAASAKAAPPTTAPNKPAAPAPAAPSIDPVAEFRTSLEAVRAFPNPRERAQEFGRILQRWLEHDADSALSYVRQLPAGALRTQGVLMTLDFISQHDPERGLTLAGEVIANHDEQVFYSLLFARLAQRDPTAAAQRLAAVPAAGRENAIRALTDTWAQQDVSSALGWAQKLPESDRPFAVESALRTLSETDPLHAIQVAQQSLTGPALYRTIALALQKLTPADPAAAAAIVTQLPAGETQTLAALDVARALAARNPPEALAWIKTLPAGATQRLALNNAIDGWAEKDSAGAGAYVGQMPAGAAQDAAAEHFARLLGTRDPVSARAWAESLTSSSARQNAQITIGSAWAQHDPVAATQWAAALPDGAARTGAVSGAYSYWLQRDAAAARAWLAAAALPADVKARLVRP